MENMVNVKSYIEASVKDNFSLVEWMVVNKDLIIHDQIDYNASQDMEEADVEFLYDLQSDPYFMEKVQEAVDDGMVHPETQDERLRQGYFLLRKETITKLIEDYNLVFMAVLLGVSKNYPELTQEQIDYIDGWVNDQDWDIPLEDMIRFCEQYLLGEE